MNIKQIAQKAGVSVATVSRVLNHPEKVTKKTREKIQKVMREEEYQPNWFAQGLNFKRSMSIGLIMPNIDFSNSMMIARGVEDMALSKDYFTFLCNTNGDKDMEVRCVQQLISRKVDGIIMVYSSMTQEGIRSIGKMGTKCVIIGGNNEYGRVSSVSVDGRSAASFMTRHLVESGYTRIGILCGQQPEPESKEILQAFRNVLKASGIRLQADHLAIIPNTVGGGYLGAKKMLRESRPQAIFATSDYIAFGAMDAARDVGLNIPEDVGIVGFGDDPMSSIIEPKLTTVNIPYHKMGIYGARLLIDLIEDPDNREDIKNIILKTSVKIRKSSRRIVE